MEISKEQIVAMAVAAIAEELGEEITRIRVLSFREIHKGGAERFAAEHHIPYQKYRLGE